MAQSLLGQLTKLRSHWATEYKADCHLLHTGPSSMTPTPRLEIPQPLVSRLPVLTSPRAGAYEPALKLTDHRGTYSPPPRNIKKYQAHGPTLYTQFLGILSINLHPESILADQSWLTLLKQGSATENSYFWCGHLSQTPPKVFPSDSVWLPSQRN